MSDRTFSRANGLAGAVGVLLVLLAVQARSQTTTSPLPAPPASSVTIVVEVNGQPVTRKDWEEELSLDGRWREVQAQGMRVNESDRTAVREQVLSELIDQMLVEQEAKDRKVELSTDDLHDVDRVMEEQIKLRWGEKKNLENDLAERGVPLSRLRDKFKVHFLIQRLLEADYFKTDAFVRPAEVRAYYGQHLQEYRVAGQVVMDHIDFRKTDYGGAAEARKAAQAALAEIQAGKPFGDVARATQFDYTNKEKGGEYPPVPSIDSFSPATAAALRALKPGEVAGPVEESNRFSIVRLDSVRQESYKSFEEVEDQIQQKLEEDRRVTRLNDLYARLRTQATVKRYK